MNDREFLDYCETHSHTPRCGFVPSQLARLYRLAGQPIQASYWAEQPNQIINCDGDVVRKLVEEARSSEVSRG